MQGKLTLIVIHSLKNGLDADSNRLQEILNLKSDIQSIIDEVWLEIFNIKAIALVEKSGSIDYSRKVSEKLIKEAWNDIFLTLPEGSGKQKLKCLSEFVIGRKMWFIIMIRNSNYLRFSW